MRHLNLNEWEEKYIVGPQERFDQKNELYKRSWWDPGVKEIYEKVYAQRIAPSEKAGWTLPEIKTPSV